MKIGMFGAASPYLDAEYKQLSYDTGRLIGGFGNDLITGAGNTGAMGSVMDGFTSSPNRGEAVGITTHRLIKLEGSHNKVDKLYTLESMNTRKHMIINMSDLLITLPGGFGTMDELMEVVTLQQLRISSTPVIVIDVEGGRFSEALKKLIQTFVNIKTISPEMGKIIKFKTLKEFKEML